MYTCKALNLNGKNSNFKGFVWLLLSTRFKTCFTGWCQMLNHPAYMELKYNLNLLTCV